jgi:hypothetical protein
VGGKPAVKRRSACRALLVGPKGESHAIDGATGRSSPRVGVEADSPRRLGMDRRPVGVARIRCLNLRCHARHAGYPERRQAFQRPLMPTSSAMAVGATGDRRLAPDLAKISLTWVRMTRSPRLAGGFDLC